MVTHQQEKTEDDETELSEEEDFELTTKEKLETSFELAGVSPMKLHSLPKRRKVSIAKEKLEIVLQHNTEETARVIGVDVEEIQRQEDPGNSLTKEESVKVKNYDELLYNLKEKIHCSGYKEKIQILTLAPDAWPRAKVAELFNVSEYLVRTARSLKKEKRILAIPEPKTGKKLSKQTEKLVKTFFEDDEYSRMLPGKKDCVSIARNVHKQKRLLLCNLNELFVAFKENNVSIEIGFSKFCSSRPK